MTPRMRVFYMKIAEMYAELSRARKLKVGSVIVKDDNIISGSYNGTPSGWDNNCEITVYADEDEYAYFDEELMRTEYPWTEYSGEFNDQVVRYNLVTIKEVLHSEANSLMKLAKTTQSSKDAILFTTHSPCLQCAKLIYQAGIKEVVFKHNYRSDDGIIFLKKCGVTVEQQT